MNPPAFQPLQRRGLLTLMASAPLWASGCAALADGRAAEASPATLRGTGDLGVVIQRARGAVTVVNTSDRSLLGEITGLGDLSHASVVFSRDGRYASVFGRDGGLTQVDLLRERIVHRVMQAGNSIGGAVSADGTLVAAQNSVPGGVKVFDAKTLELLADLPATYGNGQRSRVVGLVDLPQRRFAYSLFDADAICIADCSDPTRPRVHTLEGIGRQPYDALVTPDGRHYIAGLFGEDGLAMVDLWEPQPKVRRILAGYGRGQQPLPVYKMPHLRGWSVAAGRAYLPAIGRHEVLVVDTDDWREVGRIPVRSQPVFVMARPDGRDIWVNFAFPEKGWVQVIDTVSGKVTHTLQPGRGILHMEFLSKGQEVWMSSRDDNRVVIFDTATKQQIGGFDAASPSGIFFTTRAARTGF